MGIQTSQYAETTGPVGRCGLIYREKQRPQMPYRTNDWSRPAWRQVISFDFDGVLHEDPRYRAVMGDVDLALIRQAHERGYAVAILTCNNVLHVGNYLRRQGFRVFADTAMKLDWWHGGRTGNTILVSQRKIPSVAYVDDKAISYRYGQPHQTVWDSLDKLQGYYPCPSGRHWGVYGAAGILPWTVIDGEPWLLIGKRSKHVGQPGTWGGFGGALHEGEEPFTGALRELSEEVTVAVTATGGKHHVSAYRYVCPHCGWTYVTYLQYVEPDVSEKAQVRDHWETDELRWVRVDHIGEYRLHPAFTKALPELRFRIEGELAAHEAYGKEYGKEAVS